MLVIMYLNHFCLKVKIDISSYFINMEVMHIEYTYIMSNNKCKIQRERHTEE